MSLGEIFVVSGLGQGHVSPCMELCKLILARNYHTTLVVPLDTSPSFLPSTFASHPRVSITQIPCSLGPPMGVADPVREKAAQVLSSQLSNRPGSPRMLCAIIDMQFGWTREVFAQFDIPVVSFFTFGACAAAMEWGTWKAQATDLKPGEARSIAGLPEEMAITYAELKRKPSGPPKGGPGGGPKGPGGRGGGGPKPGERPPWVPEIEKAEGLMFNTCDDLERPFLSYMEDQIGIPAWGVGPLLPEDYWKTTGSIIRDGAARGDTRQSNYTEDEIIGWLDKKPRGSVLYVAFGSLLSPTEEEYLELASALEESSRPFIWVIQSKDGSYFPHGLDAKVGDRGLIINGWAPQLLILSHPSTGGFLSHCGWNSTAEALGRGVPFLAWPIRGDQHMNAKLVVNHLRVGYRVADDLSENVKKDDIASGIEKLMGDEEMRERAAQIKAKFQNGFPASSDAAMDAFLDFVNKKMSV